MNLTPKRWRVAPALSDSQLRAFRGLNPILATLLYQRGLTDHAAALRFLHGECTLANPFTMLGVTKAVPRLRTAINKGELIVVYGDFDADGVTSTALLVTALRALGANVRHYIPHRVDEGYGLNSEALAKIAKAGARVVVTVDCGIRSLREVEDGQRFGLDMIVTDHHSVGPDVPEGFAVINPKQPGCKYGENMLAGVGIAYRLADALFMAQTNTRGSKPPFPVEDLLDLVAIGTVADLAPLDRAENRAMVIRGLDRIRSQPRPGIRALLQVSGTEPELAGSDTIGFRLGPRINAAGRLESAKLAYDLLMAERIEDALPLAEDLNTLNVQRQELTREMQARAAELVGEPSALPLIFADSPDFQQGIVGLVAGRLVEQFYRPAVVLHRGASESHGSCRSIDGFNITEALDECADLLIRHGGHAQAAGFALLNENIPLLKARLIEIAGARLDEETLVPALRIDAETRLHELSEDLFYDLKQLEPTGNSNPAPLLCARRLRVARRYPMGADKQHLKLIVSEYNCEMEAVAFRMGGLLDAIPETVDLAFRLDINEYQGQKRLQLLVEDIQPASVL